MKRALRARIPKGMPIWILCPPAGMEPEEGGALSAGLTTPDADAGGPLFVGPAEGPTTLVTTEDAVMTLTTGVEEATQMVGIVRRDVTVTL